MEKEIEKVIRETLVTNNTQSINIAVNKIALLFNNSKCSRKCRECNKLITDCSDFCSKRCETIYYR